MSDMKAMNEKIIEEFRANEGKVGGHLANATLLLLHTTGAKSGKPRINPLVVIPDGDRIAVIASKGGAPTHPDWYHNLVANPEVSVELGTEQFKAHAKPAPEPERTELFAKMVSINPDFGEYEKKVKRTIPVVVLTRRP